MQMNRIKLVVFFHKYVALKILVMQYLKQYIQKKIHLLVHTLDQSLRLTILKDENQLELYFKEPIHSQSSQSRSTDSQVNSFTQFKALSRQQTFRHVSYFLQTMNSYESKKLIFQYSHLLFFFQR